MYKPFLLILFSYFLLIACSSAKETFTTTVIMFDKEVYEPTHSVDIKVFSSRLDIPNKYVELGTIKFTGEPIIDQIKQLASDKGADAVIRDANNFILIKYKTEQQKEEYNETKTI